MSSVPTFANSAKEYPVKIQRAVPKYPKSQEEIEREGRLTTADKGIEAAKYSPKSPRILTDEEIKKEGWEPCLAKVPNDPVNSPSHYTDGGIETIDFIEAKKLSYNTGNAVKYITRAGKKNPNGCVWTDFQRDTFAKQDLEKAVWYLQREIKNLKTKLE